MTDESLRPVFGHLEDVDLRRAWTHEAREFTPWLAENMERLSQAIGISLLSEGTEVSVGSFSADILARDPNGDAVLIENQLDSSDHNHLGQIMTYLTGLEAKSIVWVAPRFRDEHLSAIRWLNENTRDQFAFFAVKVRVVRIGSSAMAPLFEVLEQPNGWDRQVQQTARANQESSPASRLRDAFFAKLTSRYSDIHLSVGGPGNRWWVLPEVDLVLSLFIGGGASVGLFVRGPRGADYFANAQRLAPHQKALEKDLAAPMGRPRYLFEKSKDFDLTNDANWDAAGDWLVAQGRRYADTLRQVLATSSNAMRAS